MTTTTLDLKVTADARSAVSGLRPLETSLKDVTEGAEDAEKALKDLDREYKVKINDEAIDRARRDIIDLQQQIRRDVELGADTKVAQRRIRELKSAIRLIEADDIDIDVDIDDYSLTKLEKARGQLSGFKSLGGPAALGLRAFGEASKFAAVGAGSFVAAFAGTSVWVAGLASDMQNAKIAFTQFLGSGEKAQGFLTDLQKFAAKTPFEFSELIESSKTLMAFGINAKDIVPIMTTLGDAAALTGSEVSDLTTIWGQMQAKGKVANEELLQLTEHGIPAYQELADAMGLTVPEIQELAKKGKLLSSDVLPLLKKQMDETFGGGMAKQAETLGGKFSTLKDTLDQFGREAGTALTPLFDDLLAGGQNKLTQLADYVSNNKAEVIEGFAQIADGIANAAQITTDILSVLANVVGQYFETLGSTMSIASDIIGSLPGGWVAKKLGLDQGMIDKYGEFGDDLHQLGSDSKSLADGMGQAADAIGDARDSLATAAASAALEERIKKQRGVVKGLKTDLQELGEQKPTPEVLANTSDLKKKLADARTDLASLKDKQVTVTATADTSSAQQALNQLIYGDYKVGIGVYAKPSSSSSSGTSNRSIVPQLSGPDASTVAGLRIASARAPEFVAATPYGTQKVESQRVVTELAPRQTPIKVYLDGAEIADHLTLKAGRLASTSSIRRRA